MKPKLLHLLVIQIISINLLAQGQLSLGLSGGYIKNYLYTNISNRAFTEYSPLKGFSGSLPIQYQFNNWLAVQAEPSYIQKNYRISRSGFFGGIYQNTTNTYFQLPLLAHFMFGGNRVKGFMNLGAYGAYWASSHVKGSLANVLDLVDNVQYNQNINSYYEEHNPYNYDEKYQFDSRKDRRIEIGWLVGAGVSYKITKQTQLYGEARYYQSITDQQKNYMINQIPRYNQTYTLNIGFLTSLPTLFRHHAKNTSDNIKK